MDTVHNQKGHKVIAQYYVDNNIYYKLKVTHAIDNMVFWYLQQRV